MGPKGHLNPSCRETDILVSLMPIYANFTLLVQCQVTVGKTQAQ